MLDCHHVSGAAGTHGSWVTVDSESFVIGPRARWATPADRTQWAIGPAADRPAQAPAMRLGPGTSAQAARSESAKYTMFSVGSERKEMQEMQELLVALKLNLRYHDDSS